MPLVNIELDTLKGWFSRLEGGKSDSVIEEIYDEIQAIEKHLKDGRVQLEQQKIAREKEIEKMEKPLLFNQLEVDKHYRFMGSVNFTSPRFNDLGHAEVKIVSKGRTQVKVLVIEPGKKTTGNVLTTAPHHLTTL